MVSFIVIGKNEGDRLIRCIESIRIFIDTENIIDSEIIYVDSQSSDNSIEHAITAGADRVYLIQGQCNAAIGRNIGAGEAKGDILFFLDGDMELIHGFWRTVSLDDKSMVYPFISGTEKDVLYDNDWEYVTNRLRRSFSPGIDSYEVTTGGLFCISRKLWDIVGGIDSRLKVNEDLDLGIRLWQQGYKLCRKPQIWVNHHTRFYGIRSNDETGVKYVAVFIRKHFFEPKMQMKMFLSTYSYWILLFCVLSLIFLPISYWWVSILFYLAVVGYRTVQIIRRTSVKMNFIRVFAKRFAKDFEFWWYFITFWPQTINLKYNCKFDGTNSF